LWYGEAQREKIAARAESAGLDDLNALALLLERLKADKQIESSAARFVKATIGLRYVKIALEERNEKK
jgi:ribosome assembly protein YihI (activator of Der GTPase)